MLRSSTKTAALLPSYGPTALLPRFSSFERRISLVCLDVDFALNVIWMAALVSLGASLRTCWTETDFAVPVGPTRSTGTRWARQSSSIEVIFRLSVVGTIACYPCIAELLSKSCVDVTRCRVSFQLTQRLSSMWNSCMFYPPSGIRPFLSSFTIFEPSTVCPIWEIFLK
jgi:hypothetical protein